MPPASDPRLAEPFAATTMDLLDEVSDFAPHFSLRSSLDFFSLQPDLSTSSGSSSSASSDQEQSPSRTASSDYVPSFEDEPPMAEESSDVSPVASKKRTAGGGKTKAAASRKRKTPTAEGAAKVDPKQVDSVTLDRDVLLTISSADFDSLVAGISERRRLSEAEQKEVRRQKRLIKNRESAALSRNRKKQALETLEEENTKLRDELSLMRQFLERTNQMASFVSSMAAPLGASQRSGAGLLFVCVLSFGLFVNVPALVGSGLQHPSSCGAAVGHAASGPNMRQLMSVENASLQRLGSWECDRVVTGSHAGMAGLANRTIATCN